jgi:hypothetical protein
MSEICWWYRIQEGVDCVTYTDWFGIGLVKKKFPLFFVVNDHGLLKEEAKTHPKTPVSPVYFLPFSLSSHLHSMEKTWNIRSSHRNAGQYDPEA